MKDLDMHAWYSTQHALACDPAIYEDTEGKPTAVTFVCRDFQTGQRYVQEQFPHFPDYRYIGVVGRCIHETPLPGDEEVCCGRDIR